MKKLPRGVTIKRHRSGNETLQIAFTYKGVRCREALSNIGTKVSDIRYAENMLGQIKFQIANGTFNYADHFPESSKIEIFYGSKVNKTIKYYLDEYVKSCELRGLSFTSVKSYKSVVNSLSFFHNLKPAEVTHSVLKDYTLQQKISLRTCKKNLVVLKMALDEAVVDEVITSNPCIGFKPSRYINSEQRTYNTTDEIDPFTPAECEHLINSAYYFSKQEGNLVKFWLNTGLRTSELVGLTWENVDLLNHSIRIKEVMIDGKRKGPKNKYSIRTVPLNDDAYAALLSQKEFTYISFGEVFQRNGTSYGTANEVYRHLWLKVIKKSNVRYRKCYNCRHTFATMNISRNVNIWQLSQWMGHSSPQMLFKHYGKFIEEFAKESTKQSAIKDIANSRY